MRPLPNRLAAHLLPKGWPDLLRQILLFCGAYWAYRIVRGMTDGRIGEAFDNARDVISIERGLGLFVEPAVQAWAQGSDLLIDGASWMYVNSHFAITTVTLAFIYLRRNASFYFIRNMFMVAMAIALVLYAAYPTAPPRFMPEWGFSDSYFLGGIAFILGSICDTLDGRYSRMSGKGTSFGAFLDSTLDRMEEGIVLTAVAYQFSEAGDDAAVAAVVVAVLASLMVSYTRARAEALGVECKVGIADRAVRVVILSAGLVLAKGAGVFDVELLEPAVWLLAGLSVITVAQRIFHVRQELKSAPAL